MNCAKLVLPFPPSANHYYRHPTKGPLAGRHLISEDGRAYRTAVRLAVLQQLKAPVKTMVGRLAVTIVVNPPDLRRRDLGNMEKALNDSLQHAGVFRDDSQIDDLRIIRDEPLRGGRVVVTVEEAAND